MHNMVEIVIFIQKYSMLLKGDYIYYKLTIKFYPI